jgi:hypothetical protein
MPMVRSGPHIPSCRFRGVFPKQHSSLRAMWISAEGTTGTAVSRMREAHLTRAPMRVTRNASAASHTKAMRAFVVRLTISLAAFFVALVFTLSLHGVPRPASPWPSRIPLTPAGRVCRWALVAAAVDSGDRDVRRCWLVEDSNGTLRIVDERHGRDASASAGMREVIIPVHNALVDGLVQLPAIVSAFAVYWGLTRRHVTPRCYTCGGRLVHLETARCPKCSAPL